MSGGLFDYDQYRIQCIADEVERLLEPDSEESSEFSERTLAEFKEGLSLLRKAYIYAQRIDWLVSGDDSEEYFHRRLQKELLEHEKTE